MFKLKKQTVSDVLRLALPAVGEMILYMMIWVFDTMMVGKYGGNVAVSTVGLSSEILYTFSNIFISVGLAVGITSLVARRVGAKEFDHAEEYATLGLICGILVSIILSIILFAFSGNLLVLAGADSNVINTGTMFMRIASIGIFFNMIMTSINGILRGFGNTKTPLYASILINIINLGLDYLLIFGNFGFPQLGIKGAAIATASAQTIGFIYICYFLMKKSTIKPRLKYVKDFTLSKLVELVKLSIPSSMQEAAFSLSRLITVFLIMHLGTLAFAANQITTTIESVSFMPGWGFAIAATTLVGHKIGEKNYEGAKEYAYTCMWLGLIVMSFCSLLFLICPKFLISSFIMSSETEVIRLGAACLMIAAIEQPAMAVSMILGGALKGYGDTTTPFVISLISSWVIRLPLMIYFIYVLKTPVYYFWVITSIQWCLDGGAIYFMFSKKFNKFVIKKSKTGNNENVLRI